MSSELLPCPFCLSTAVKVYPPTCDKTTPYNSADRAFPVVRCWNCSASKDGKDWDKSGKSAIEAWNTRASQPPGFVLVPLEPTPEMCRAYLSAVGRHIPFSGMDPAICDGYRAMVAAAPKEPK